MARHADVRVPASNMLRSLAQILTDEGFIASFHEDHDDVQGTLVLQLRYAADKTNVITGIRRESRPGQRRYVGVGEIPRVKNGMGIAILSTPSGVMTGARARQANVGGELICTVW